MTYRIAVLPMDESACGFYRMRLPAGAVRTVRPDWQIEVYRPGDIRMGVDAQGRLHQIAGLPDADKFDLIVMQRISQPAMLDMIRWFQSNGAAVVVDSDDAMWCIDPANSAYTVWNHPQSGHSWRHLDVAARMADMVTVTTQTLANRYGQSRGHAEVLPNCVPGDIPQYLESVRPALDQTTTIGWAGFTSTHPGDLRVVGPAVADAVKANGCLVRVIGDAEGAAKDWGTPCEMVQPTPIGMPYYTALTTLDIGLVPLRDTNFNRGKSYLKALEFAAVGVAVVASDTPANRMLAKTVPIRLAANPYQWFEHIEDLVQHPEKREAQAAAAQAAVYLHHTYEANAERWAQVWERAISRRERMLA